MAKDSPDKRPDPSNNTQSTQWFALAGLGVEFAVTVIGGGLLGWYLDKRWDTSPWLLLVGVFIGFAAGLYYMIRTVRKVFRD